MSESLVRIVKEHAKFNSMEAWQKRHQMAWNYPTGLAAGIKQGLLCMAHYGDAYARRFESRIGDDWVLREGWLSIWRGLRTLLAGDFCGLDRGTIDALLFKLARAAGFADDELE